MVTLGDCDSLDTIYLTTGSASARSIVSEVHRRGLWTRCHFTSLSIRSRARNHNGAPADWQSHSGDDLVWLPCNYKLRSRTAFLAVRFNPHILGTVGCYTLCIRHVYSEFVQILRYVTKTLLPCSFKRLGSCVRSKSPSRIRADYASVLVPNMSNVRPSGENALHLRSS